MREENRIQTKETQEDDLLSYLNTSYKNKEIVLIYTNPEQTQSFSAGVVSEIFDKIKILSKINKTKHDKLCRVKDDAFLTLLTYAFETKKVVTIELIDSDNNDAIGFVEQINDKCCTVSMLNDYGEEDGVSIFNVSDISHLSCGGDDELVLKQLHDNLYANQCVKV
ncbi:MAG: hypothetical protein Q8N92_03570 [Erysipelotrichaceae bacterium]|nr:hypothetical protein [Erysipelotrichaceae bacterium]